MSPLSTAEKSGPLSNPAKRACAGQRVVSGDA